MKRLRDLAQTLGVVLLAAVLSELPWLKRAGEAIDRLHDPLLAVTIGLTALGFTVFMGGILRQLMAPGEPITAGEDSFAGMKEAWRSGQWRRDPHWRRLLVVASGAALLMYGLFGLLLVIGPGPIRVIAAGALVYATVMTARGFNRA
jgi:hypothetical protein